MIYKPTKKWRLMKMNWNELLRPTKPVEIVGNNVFVEDFLEWEKTGEYPSAILILGPPGTGKSSAANAITHTMLGQWNNDMNVLWTNASDDRGIGHVRQEIKQFCRLSGINAARKVVVLDEADGLTPQSQDALRGIMEKYAHRVLFVLTANYPEKIKPAIQSRCKIYQFTPVTPKEGARHLLRATESCGAPVEWEQAYEDVVEHFNGDLRAAVNFLESRPKNQELSFIKTTEAWWDDFKLHDDYNSLREKLNENMETAGSRVYFMNKFHQYIRGYFDKDPDTVFAIMSVWGDMMEKVHEWPGSDNAFVDVVARLKKQIGEMK
jgi:DNA polymerase III delta prime subunit